MKGHQVSLRDPCLNRIQLDISTPFAVFSKITKLACNKVYPFHGVLSSPNVINVNGFVGPPLGFIVEVWNTSVNFIVLIPDALLLFSCKGCF